MRGLRKHVNRAAALAGCSAIIGVGLLTGPATPAAAGDCSTSRVASGQAIASGQKFRCDSTYLLRQDDTLFIIGPGGLCYWASGLDNVVMQSDGNFVAFRGASVVKDTQTGGNPGATLSVNSDGNVVVYAPDGRILRVLNESVTCLRGRQ